MNRESSMTWEELKNDRTKLFPEFGARETKILTELESLPFTERKAILDILDHHRKRINELCNTIDTLVWKIQWLEGEMKLRNLMYK